MADFNDPMATLKKLQQNKSKAKKKGTAADKEPFDNPLTSRVSMTDASKATKSGKMVGQYAQRTFRLPPEYLELIRRIAADEIMSIADAERWVVSQGLLAYFENGERPQFEQSVQRQVQLPRWDY